MFSLSLSLSLVHLTIGARSARPPVAQTAAISTLLRQLGALLEAWVNVGVFEAVGAALDAELGDREARDAQLLELECTALQFLMHPRGEVRADAVQARRVCVCVVVVM